ncbi:Protein CBG04054 [Caenorhabditis briggsae]|uniref:Protein CBG04054 n=1 Tax=Caenorhabditis briggsae TaxID=6238 RepID=A8WW37_CAEBR|nr:Protein CBG04054 [Caenorhabditis briggsae]CAP24846.2 Protein CBG04054 [Caenorhabditis briggsae]
MTDGPVSPQDHHKPAAQQKLNLRSGPKSVEKFAKALDTNNDGFVDKNELLAWVSESYQKTVDREAVERMSELDENADGFVSWEEYLLDSFPEEELHNKEEETLIAQDRMYFKQADQDDDGKLNLEELASFLNPEHHPHMHSVLIAVTLLEKDQNGDGAIDEKEFLGELDDQRGSEWYKVEVERFHTVYDHNKDGKLSGDELVAWLLVDGTTAGSYEAQSLLNNADDDKDGKLSYDEIVKHHALFAKTEAAQEADHLHPYSHDEL